MLQKQGEMAGSVLVYFCKLIHCEVVKDFALAFPILYLGGGGDQGEFGMREVEARK
jgi:hypothetical protein